MIKSSRKFISKNFRLQRNVANKNFETVLHPTRSI